MAPNKQVVSSLTSYGFVHSILQSKASIFWDGRPGSWSTTNVIGWLLCACAGRKYRAWWTAWPREASLGIPFWSHCPGSCTKIYTIESGWFVHFFFEILRQKLWTNRLQSARKFCGISKLCGTYICKISHSRLRRPANFAIIWWPVVALLLICWDTANFPS